MKFPKWYREAPRGWPRPLHRWRDRTLPLPWIAQVPDDAHPEGLAFGQVHKMRKFFAVAGRRCQVCGDELGTWAIVCAKDGDMYVADGAAIHPERCWPTARRLCPALVRELEAGVLVAWKVRTVELVMDELEGAYQTPGCAPDPALLR